MVSSFFLFGSYSSLRRWGLSFPEVRSLVLLLLLLLSGLIFFVFPWSRPLSVFSPHGRLPSSSFSGSLLFGQSTNTMRRKNREEKQKEEVYGHLTSLPNRYHTHLLPSLRVQRRHISTFTADRRGVHLSVRPRGGFGV